MPASSHLITRALLLTSLVVPLSGCDLLGLGPDPRIAQKEADAKAIGAACRHGLRSIEDCYTLNKGVSRANIYAGWREMDEYMRENKIEGLRAEIPVPPPAPPAPPTEEVVEPQPKAKAH
ncbi:MAG: hypothetical protein Fur007_13080 [Rhodoferax sp.]